MHKIFHNVETGEVVEVQLSAREIDELKKQWAIVDAEIAAKQAVVDAKNTQRQELLSKLGITEDEARLLLGGN